MLNEVLNPVLNQDIISGNSIAFICLPGVIIAFLVVSGDANSLLLLVIQAPSISLLTSYFTVYNSRDLFCCLHPLFLNLSCKIFASILTGSALDEPRLVNVDKLRHLLLQPSSQDFR